MTSAYDIIVLGAGFTGAALTAQLSALAGADTRILLAGDEVSLGLAYGAAAPTHLLNVAAGRMSMYPDRPDDFVEWLTTHGLAGEQAIQGVPLPERFLPRAIYGQYVQDRLRAAVATSPGRVTQQTAQAVALARDGDAWRVTFADGAVATAHQVAICLGNQASALPLPPGEVAPGAAARVIADPWRDTRLGGIGPTDRVLVIGTGLTMVDYVLQREQDGQPGQTVALSRRGLLPEVHTLHAEAGVRVPGIEQPVTLADLTRLVRDEIAARAARGAQGGDWRPVVDGLRPDTQRLWLGLSPREQSRFLRHLGAHWGVARHRMPPIAGERLAAMQADGRLVVHSGRLTRLAPTGGRIDATVALRGVSTPAHETVDWVVNCTGPGRDPARTGNPFLLALLDADIARSDTLRLGLATDDHDQVVAPDGTPQPGLYALGPVAMGRLYEIVAVPDLRVQVARVATQLTQA